VPDFPEALTEVLPRVRRRDRVRDGVREPRNWWQLARFTAVGASGYVINLATFALVVGLTDDYRLAALVAFLVAVTNNFVWNRHWTFDARDGHAGSQAVRFLAVSVAGFLINLGLLELLVGAGLREVLAQALAVAAATPCNFIGNKLWTFGA
jgi:dolichol-phosphate mannosyltransferase